MYNAPQTLCKVPGELGNELQLSLSPGGQDDASFTLSIHTGTQAESLSFDAACFDELSGLLVEAAHFLAPHPPKRQPNGDHALGTLKDEHKQWTFFVRTSGRLRVLRICSQDITTKEEGPTATLALDGLLRLCEALANGLTRLYPESDEPGGEGMLARAEMVTLRALREDLLSEVDEVEEPTPERVRPRSRGGLWMSLLFVIVCGLLLAVLVSPDTFLPRQLNKIIKRSSAPVRLKTSCWLWKRDDEGNILKLRKVLKGERFVVLDQNEKFVKVERFLPGAEKNKVFLYWVGPSCLVVE
ncbi:MAG: hypothetical protein CL920_32160 [Deltaproteobacteria bacterium]|nr:hypothetical protein [Deltaproteobacteria bacterium]MBU53374.1 hypothetical protein [Deltaproteobacteria bacterium]